MALKFYQGLPFIYRYIRRATRGEGEASPALNKEEKFVPEFSLKDYEILTNKH